MPHLAAALTLLVPLHFAMPSRALAQAPPSWTDQHGAFAFPDESGTHLLTPAALAHPEALRAALCTGNRRIIVQFERRQTEGQSTSGRQLPNNFANTSGVVFRVTSGRVDSTATCFLWAESFMTGATLIALIGPAAGARCPKQRYPQFQVDKGRPVVACWPIAESSTGIEVAMIEFARRLTHALASLVVIDQETRIYVDYPAEFNGPGADLWRADDGGEVHPERFEVVFLLKRGPDYLLAINWNGAEGSALSLLSAAGSNQFKELISDSWYRSPF